MVFRSNVVIFVKDLAIPVVRSIQVCVNVALIVMLRLSNDVLKCGHKCFGSIGSIATLHVERKIEEKINLKMSTRISGAEKTRSVSKVLCEADVSRLYSSLVGEREKEVTLKCKRYLGSSFRFQISVLW